MTVPDPTLLQSTSLPYGVLSDLPSILLQADGITFDLQSILLLIAVAFVPPIIFAAAVAGAKRYRKEPTYTLRRAFIWGATGAAFIALIINTMVTGVWARPYVVTETGLLLLTALVVAPVVEETTKGIGMTFVRKETDEVADGLIYGAVIGLGFAATENLFYETGALIQQGQAAWFWTAVGRTFSSTFLHATASAMVGYGVARARVGEGTVFGVVAWWFGAVGLHAAFNFLATFGAVFGVLGLVPLIIFAIWGFSRVRSRVTELSLVAPHARWERVGRHQEVDAAGDEETGWILVGHDDASARWRIRDDRGLDDDTRDRGAAASRHQAAEGAFGDEEDGHVDEEDAATDPPSQGDDRRGRRARGDEVADDEVETWYPTRGERR